MAAQFVINSRRLVQSALRKRLSLPTSQQSRCVNSAESTHQRRYVPRRACLYVPGSDRRKVIGAASLDVDCVILDCEDGVASNRKDLARETIRDALNTTQFGKSECAVRVNTVDSGLMEEDLRYVMGAVNTPSTVFLPKVTYPHELDKFSDCLNDSLAGKIDVDPIRLIISVESAMAVLNLRDVLLNTVRHPLNSRFYVDGVLFGSDDFCADIGVSRTEDGSEVIFARQQILLTAKAFGLQAIDMVYIDYKDLSGLQTQCERGAQLGFTGKQAIHPAQVPVVQAAFSPSDEKVQWAREIVNAFDEHQKSGEGAFTLRDKMIDMPSVLQARNVLEMYEKICST